MAKLEKGDGNPFRRASHSQPEPEEKGGFIFSDAVHTEEEAALFQQLCLGGGEGEDREEKGGKRKKEKGRS